MSNELVRLAVDLTHNATGEFSANDAESTLRQALIDLNGGSENFDYRAFRKNKVAMFEAIEEILEVLITEGIQDQFNDFVEYRNVAFGDKPYFMVEDYHLFPVATISSGNNNMRRQRLHRTPFTVPTKWKGIKIYSELESFLAGRVNWALMISKIQKSFNAQLAADIQNALVNGYNALSAPYLYNGTADRTQLNTLVNHIESATQREAIVYGTKLALQQITPAYAPYAGSGWDQRNNDGFFRVIDGIKLVELPQAHTPGTDSFAISDKMLIVVPQGEEKIVKVLDEGTPLVDDSTSRGDRNADDSVEFSFRKKYGVGVVTSTKFGAYIMP